MDSRGESHPRWSVEEQMWQAIRLDRVGEGGYDFSLMRDVIERLGAVLFHPGGGRGGRRRRTSCSGHGGRGESCHYFLLKTSR